MQMGYMSIVGECLIYKQENKETDMENMDLEIQDSLLESSESFITNSYESSMDSIIE